MSYVCTKCLKRIDRQSMMTRKCKCGHKIDISGNAVWRFGGDDIYG